MGHTGNPVKPGADKNTKDEGDEAQTAFSCEFAHDLQNVDAF